MARVNWFDANREFATNVAEYMVCVFWKRAITLEFGQKIKEARESLEKVDNLKGSIMADKIPELKKFYLAEIGKLEEQEREQIRRQGTYAPSAADVTLKKALKAYVDGKTEKTPAESVQAWLAAYGLEVDLYNPIISEILGGSGDKFRFKTAVKTNAHVVTGFNDGNCYAMAFAKCYEHMVQVGTIKAVQIPEIIREKYAPKKKTSKKNK